MFTRTLFLEAFFTAADAYTAFMQPFLPRKTQGFSAFSAGIGPETCPKARGNSRKSVVLSRDLEKPFARFACSIQDSKRQAYTQKHRFGKEESPVTSQPVFPLIGQ
jgi:hypothetical protein